MSDIELTFEEIPLCIGNNGKRQSIALISGTAQIVVHNGYWEIESVWLDRPITEHKGITIDCRHPIFDFVSESISHECGDRIWDEVIELGREYTEMGRKYSMARE